MIAALGKPCDQAALFALGELLEDTARVIAQLAPDEYTDSDVPGVSGSIGGHVRHCLDHVRALEVEVVSAYADRVREAADDIAGQYGLVIEYVDDF